MSRRRKKSTWSEESESSGNLNVNDKEEAWCSTGRWTGSPEFIAK